MTLPLNLNLDLRVRIGKQFSFNQITIKFIINKIYTQYSTLLATEGLIQLKYLNPW